MALEFFLVTDKSPLLWNMLLFRQTGSVVQSFILKLLLSHYVEECWREINNSLLEGSNRNQKWQEGQRDTKSVIKPNLEMQESAKNGEELEILL